MPTTLTSLAADLRQAIFRTHRRVRSETGTTAVSYPQFSALASLWREGPTTPGRLAEIERVQPPTMTRTVNSLVELGLATKADHPDDGRQVVVALTAAGQAEIAETVRRRDEWLTSRLERLAPEDRDVLARAAQLLKDMAAS
jgi:DNA-binding MarR family transcriptional regulator